MITLSQLLKLTPKPILGRGYRECRVTIKEVSMKMDKDGEHKYCSGTARGEDGERIVIIKFYQLEGKKNPVDCPVWLHCSCEYYKYTVETVNARKGSSSVVLSNGRSPVYRNRREIPHLCKHLVAFAKAVYKMQPKLSGIDISKNPKKPSLLPQPKKNVPASPKQLTLPMVGQSPKPMTGSKPNPILGPTRPAKP